MRWQLMLIKYQTSLNWNDNKAYILANISNVSEVESIYDRFTVFQ